MRREFHYEGFGGRISQERTIFGDGTDALETSYFYDMMGLLAEIDYPNPSWGGTLPSIVTYGHVNGDLAKVGDETSADRYVKSVTYGPGGMVRKVKLANYTESEFIPDPRNRPGRIIVRVPDPSASLNAPGTGSHRLATARPAWLENWIWSRPLASQDEPTEGPLPLPADLIAQTEITPLPGGGGGSATPLVEEWNSGAYVYDGAGNIIGIGEDTFQYDGTNRLILAGLRNLPDGSQPKTISYAYDEYGNMINRTEMVSLSSRTWDFTMDDGNHVIELDYFCGDSTCNSLDTPHAYDAVGNLVSDGKRRYLFDRDSRLREVRDISDPSGERSLSQYSYDDRGYRVMKAEDGVEVFYVRDLQGRVLSEYKRPVGSQEPPVWDKDYVYALGNAIALVKNDAPAPPTEFHVSWSDDLGSMDVSLDWRKSQETDIASYTLTRQNLAVPADTVTYSISHGTASDPVTYFDDNVPGGAYEYHLVTLDTAGNVSDTSRRLVVDVNQAEHEYVTWMSPPTTPGDNFLTLHWAMDEQFLDRTVGYKIYRKAPGETEFTLITPDALEAPGFSDFGLVNREGYSYKVTVINTRGQEPALSDAGVVEVIGTPEDTVPPSPPPSASGYPGPAVGQATVQWAAAYAPDLMGYLIYQEGVSQPVYSAPLFTAVADVYLVNFTSPEGEVVPGYQPVTAHTAWPTSAAGVDADGEFGWVDVIPGHADLDDPNSPSELLDSTNNWHATSFPAAVFRMSVSPGPYLVKIGVGHAFDASRTTVDVNGYKYWQNTLIDGGSWAEQERLIYANDGLIEVAIGGGGIAGQTYINFIEVRAAVGNPTLRTATIENPTCSLCEFTVRAYDDDWNISSDSETVTVSPWREGGGVEVRDYQSGSDSGPHYIYDWGYRRFSSFMDPEPLDFDADQYGYPMLFRAAHLLIRFPSFPTPCPEVNIYRQDNQTLHWDLLTPEPIAGVTSTFELACAIFYYDREVVDLVHKYRVVFQSGTGREYEYRYRYHDRPEVVMGQHAAGANLITYPLATPMPGYEDIAIDPEGGHELGDLPVLHPVVLTWQASPNPDVVGYRIWVEDMNRHTETYRRRELATIAGRENTIFLDDEAPLNWPVVMQPDNDWDWNRCIVLRGNSSSPKPCVTSTKDYLAFYYVQGLTDLTAPSEQPIGVENGRPWDEAVRAVRLGFGECPVPEEFCDDCPGTCTWPATWPAEEVFRINFLPWPIAGQASYPGYENVTETTQYPVNGGIQGNKLMGWQEISGLISHCPDPQDPTCEYYCQNTECGTHPDIRPETSVCYANANPDTRTFKMYTGPGDFQVGIIGGDSVYFFETTLSVNGVPYWTNEFPNGGCYCNDLPSCNEVICGVMMEKIITADSQGYINITIGGTETYSGHASCIAAVRVQAMGTNPPPLASVLDAPLVAPGGSEWLLASNEARTSFPGDEKEEVLLGSLVMMQSEPADAIGAASSAEGKTVAKPAEDRLVGQTAPARSVHWLHVDHLGSTRIVTDRYGAVVSRHKYLPFGGESTDAGADQVNSHKFTGHERDRRTGLDYMFARYYSPESTFRFLSVDPAAESARPELPQTWNRYAYSLSNPLRYTDGTGETVELAPGLKKGHERRIVRALARALRNPKFGAKFENLEKSKTRYVFGTRDLPKHKSGPGQYNPEYGKTDPPQKAEDGSTVVRVDIDPSNIDLSQQPGSDNPKTDVQVEAHEVFHADDMEGGGTGGTEPDANAFGDEVNDDENTKKRPSKEEKEAVRERLSGKTDED